MANGLPHRSRDLEATIANLQLGPFAPRVHAILDRRIRDDLQDLGHRVNRKKVRRLIG